MSQYLHVFMMMTDSKEDSPLYSTENCVLRDQSHRCLKLSLPTSCPTTATTTKKLPSAATTSKKLS